MDENTEKRVKRPRIGENKGEAMENESRYSNYETRGAQGADDQHEAGAGYNQNYSRQRNYGNQGGYNRQGGYNQGGYNQNRQGGYNQNRQGGYNQNRQGGYKQKRQGGLKQNPPRLKIQ